MSAFGGKADVIQGVAEGPLLAKSGHLDGAISLNIFDIKAGLRRILNFQTAPIPLKRNGWLSISTEVTSYVDHVDDE